ncbi:uncharacterized protein LOC110855167 [Folsomia candida]|uniref:uncharacterized protein LOC110855167 n=1 Tax=Folsomia candida TaxID=158441 RepID=UPI000B8FEEE4|nr:uncharacterized protein LOC110855167 [Folsomia candida]
MNYVVDSIKKDAVRGIDLEAVLHKIMCEDCEIGKQSRKPFPAATRNATIKPGEMVHMDLAGKMSVASLGGAQYFLLLKDDATGFRTVYFLKSKDEAKDRIKCYIEFMENQTGRKVKICRSDNGGEFCNSTLASYFRDRGIIHETTVSYNPEMNGRSEREIRTLKDCARTILLAAKLPESLWAEAVATTVYVHNRILDKQSPNITAFEAIFGKKPSLRHLRVFGSVAFAHIPAQKRTVWGAKGERLILCGYASESKKYRLYDPESGQVVEARNVSFHEEAFEPTVMIHGEEERDEPDESKSEKDDAKDDAQDDAQDDAEWTDEEKYDPEDPQPDQVDPQPVQPDNEKMGDELEVQVKTEKGDYTARIPSQGTTRVVLPETSKKSGTTRNLRDRAKIKKPDRYQAHAIYADKEPSTYKEAVESKEKEEWIKAMQDEIESHKKNGTWKYVKRVLPLLAVGVIIGVTVLVAGLSVGGAINSFVQTGRISALQGTVAEQREMLDELERRVEISEREIEKLKVSLNATLEQLQLHQLDHDELKSIDTNFAIAYLTSRLMIVSFAQSQKCEISDDRTKLYVDFTATEINKDLQLIEADSFGLKVERKNETCVLKYKGPHNAILSTKDDCVYSINVKEPTTPDLIVSPTRGCTQTAKTKNSNHFDIDHCYDKNLAEPWDFVQIKLHHGQYHIYCPGSNITIERKLQQCPASVFILPMNANFKIHDIEFSGTESSLVHQEVVDPLFTMKANWHLQPSFNWTSLMINGSTDEGGSIHYHTSNEPAWSTMEWILTLCILIIVAQASLCVFLFLKSRPNVISVRANPVETADIEL